MAVRRRATGRRPESITGAATGESALTRQGSRRGPLGSFHTFELTVPCRELDLAAAAAFEASLDAALAARPDHVGLDLSLVGFMDSAGYRALGRIEDRLRARGIHMSLSSVQGQPKKFLELLRTGGEAR